MSTPNTLRWWADQIRKCTSEFYFSHVLVADLNYAADEIEKLQVENAKLREENDKLLELAARMARALGVGRWCSADCGREFGCDWTPDGCPIANAMRELGVDE